MANLYLFEARAVSAARFKEIKTSLAETEAAYGMRCCVYATGSFGRLEAGQFSDLDLFIVLETGTGDDNEEIPLLKIVEEIKLKNALICAAEVHGIRKFDGGGKFLTSHTIGSFAKHVGADDDDYRNTLTGRMLMLLESKPLVGEGVYWKAVDGVIDKYFRDYLGHEDSFVPAFLLNDIIRMWRTFCVNYEFHRNDSDSRSKIKNLKLKFSRMITCYSAVLFIQAFFSRRNYISPEDIRLMVSLTPTERLQSIILEGNGFSEGAQNRLSALIEDALVKYSQFLELTHQRIDKAVKQYNSEEAMWKERSYEFGDTIGRIIDEIGASSQSGDRLRRIIMV